MKNEETKDKPKKTEERSQPKYKCGHYRSDHGKRVVQNVAAKFIDENCNKT
jgi:hypothetical protein